MYENTPQKDHFKETTTIPFREITSFTQMCKTSPYVCQPESSHFQTKYSQK